MAATTTPNLTVGNHIYLYRLLRDALGAGKQTLMPAVEEALAAERMSAEDLGFASTRELLEELSDFVKLTIFKGGRIYATVIAQPAWDEALAAEAAGNTSGKGNATKSWKRKKTDKSLKPQRPKRVKRGEDVPPQKAAIEKPAPSDQDEATPEACGDQGKQETARSEAAPVEGEGAAASADVEASDSEHSEDDVAPDTSEAPLNDDNATSDDQPVEDQTGDGTRKSESPAPEDSETMAPAISLTVIYDPDHANAGVTTLASTPGGESSRIQEAQTPKLSDSPSPETQPAIAGKQPVEQCPQNHKNASPESDGSRTETKADETPVPTSSNQQAEIVTEQIPEPSRISPTKTEEATATVPAAEPSTSNEANTAVGASTFAVPQPAEPEELPEDYPRDFASDVYCPGTILRELCLLFPLGADVLGIMTEYYYIAHLRRTLSGTRRRFSFPLGYTDHGTRKHIVVTCKRGLSDRGANWVVDTIDRE